jgi:DUF4097 and DUF4098 domain-containing protein YvlB
MAGVVLLLALTASTACELAVSQGSAKSSAEWSAQYSGSDVKTLSVTTTRGTVSVTGSDRPDVTVVATKRANGASMDAVKALLEKTTIKEERLGTRLTLKAEIPKGVGLLQHGGVEVDFAIEVPRGMAIEAQTVNGPIRVEHLDGQLTMSTVNGQIDARHLGGPVTASAVNGRVALTLDRVAEDGVRAKSVNGAIGISLPADAAATLAASCVNCSVRADGLPVDRTDTSAGGQRPRHSLEGTVNGGGPAVQVSTVNGSIRFVADGSTADRLVERESDRQP